MELLTLPLLLTEASAFVRYNSSRAEPSLFGITDGKAVGTYLEHEFRRYLSERFIYMAGSSANGLDFPELSVDMKVTSSRQPQSSCPFRSARQKIYGLGYSLLIFVYDKLDDMDTQTAQLNIQHVIFVDHRYTADYQTTTGIHQILQSNGNEDDLFAFMMDRNLPLDEIQAQQLAEEILQSPPEIGYLTISNALQWRLQYRRVIDVAGNISGVQRIFGKQ